MRETRNVLKTPLLPLSQRGKTGGFGDRLFEHPTQKGSVAFCSKMAGDIILYHGLQLNQIFRFCKDGIPERFRCIPTVRVLVHQKNNLFIHPCSP